MDQQRAKQIEDAKQKRTAGQPGSPSHEEGLALLATIEREQAQEMIDETQRLARATVLMARATAFMAVFTLAMVIVTVVSLVIAHRS